MSQAEIGVIGDSGLYNMDGLTDVSKLRIETPPATPAKPAPSASSQRYRQSLR